MNPRMIHSMANELAAIKTAEEKAVKYPGLKSFGKSLALGSLGYGAGFGLATLTEEALKSVLKNPIPQDKRTLISHGVGLLGMLGTLAAQQAFSESMRRYDESKRDAKRN